jgi:diacylglycerol kinase (ATP)
LRPSPEPRAPEAGAEATAGTAPAAAAPRPKPRGLRRLWNSCLNSWGGFRGAWREEAAFRQEIAAGVVLVPLALWLGDTGLERAVLLGSLLVVVIVELLNSAIEATVDRIGTERHRLSGLAKDLGSAAVATSLVLVVVVWALVLLD